MKRLSDLRDEGLVISLTQPEGVHLPPQGKAVSQTNLMIHLNRVLSQYEDKEAGMNEDFDPDEPSLATQEQIYRLDRTDRDTEVQDACRIHDLSQKEEFIKRCENLGIPPFAMTYFMDNVTRCVTELVMRNHGIGPHGVLAVAEVLAGNTSVRALDLSANDIQDKGALAVARMMERNHCIADLNISENNLSKEGVDHIANMLVTNNTLTHLNISRNKLPCEAIQFLTNVLQTEDALQVLDLRHNLFRAKAGTHLGEMISKNLSLRELYIGWNYFGDAGMKGLCTGLTENRSLEIIDICWNEIGYQGAGYIAEFLENNGRLLELDLNNNHITDQGLQSIARGLKMNETLKVLKVGFNLVTSTGASNILESLLLNSHTGLETLHMAEVEVNTKIEDLFWRVKVQHPKFTILKMDSPGGEQYHFQKPPSALTILEKYLKDNNLNGNKDNNVDEE